MSSTSVMLVKAEKFYCICTVPTIFGVDICTRSRTEECQLHWAPARTRRMVRGTGPSLRGKPRANKDPLLTTWFSGLYLKNRSFEAIHADRKVTCLAICTCLEIIFSTPCRPAQLVKVCLSVSKYCQPKWHANGSHPTCSRPCPAVHKCFIPRSSTRICIVVLLLRHVLRCSRTSALSAIRGPFTCRTHKWFSAGTAEASI